MKKPAFLLLGFAFVAQSAIAAPTITCAAIALHKGSGETTGSISLERTIGSRAAFKDAIHSYSVQITELGLFLSIKDNESKQETQIKANLREASPYFNVIIPIHRKKKPFGGAPEIEFECK